MKRIYLSYFLDPDTPFYGGDRSFKIEQLRSMVAGDSCNACQWSFPNHAGTHIDLPRHFVPDGMCLQEYPAEFWFFKHVVTANVSGVLPGSSVGPELLEKCRIPESVELLLLKTGIGAFRHKSVYWQESPVFHPELADYLRHRFPHLRALGLDTISVSSCADRTTGREAHRAFLGGERPIILIEDMDLSAVDDSSSISRVTVAPLLVRGADAAPCTVIAEVTE